MSKLYESIYSGSAGIVKVMKGTEPVWEKEAKTPPVSETCFSFSKNGMSQGGNFFPYKIAMIMKNTRADFTNVYVYNNMLSLILGAEWKKIVLETSKDFKMLLYNHTTSQYTTKTIYAHQKNDITSIINRALMESNGTNVVLYSDVDPLWVTATIEFN